MPLRSSLLALSHKIGSYYFELVSPNEVISAQRHDIPIMDYKDFKRICKGKSIAPPVRQSTFRHLFDANTSDGLPF